MNKNFHSNYKKKLSLKVRKNEEKLIEVEKWDRLSFHFFHVDKEGLDWKQVKTNVTLPVFKSRRRKAFKADGVVNGATMFTARKYFVNNLSFSE